MPDLDIVYKQQCMEWMHKSVEVPSSSDPSKTYTVTADFSETRRRENEYHCTCKGYQFRKMCKHVQHVIDNKLICDWHQMWGMGQSKEEKENYICPKCKGKTEVVRVGV